MNKFISEKQIEKRLCDGIAKLGGKAYKFVSPGNVGVPDRMIVLPGGRISFAELKRPGEKPTEHQSMQIRRLKAAGCTVLVLDSYESVDAFLLCLKEVIL